MEIVISSVLQFNKLDYANKQKRLQSVNRKLFEGGAPLESEHA